MQGIARPAAFAPACSVFRNAISACLSGGKMRRSSDSPLAPLPASVRVASNGDSTDGAVGPLAPGMVWNSANRRRDAERVLVLAEGPVLPPGAVLRSTIVTALRGDGTEPLNVYEELIDRTHPDESTTGSSSPCRV